MRTDWDMQEYDAGAVQITVDGQNFCQKFICHSSRKGLGRC